MKNIEPAAGSSIHVFENRGAIELLLLMVVVERPSCVAHEPEPRPILPFEMPRKIFHRSDAPFAPRALNDKTSRLPVLARVGTFHSPLPGAELVGREAKLPLLAAIPK